MANRRGERQGRSIGPMLLDGRPLQEPARGALRAEYVSGLVDALLAEGFAGMLAVLVDSASPPPRLPARVRVHEVRRRWQGPLRRFEEPAALSWDLDRIRPALYHAIDLDLPRRAPCPVAVSILERPGSWIGKRILQRAEVVLAAAESLAADVAKVARVPGDRIRIVRPGLDPAFVSQPDSRDVVRERWGLERPFLAALGELDDARGLSRAWRRARSEGADVDLVAAGGAVAPGARQLGPLDAGDLAQLLSAASCLISTDRGMRWPLAVAQAMACGCPVVGYESTILVEVAGPAALLVPAGHAGALGKAAANVVLDAGAAEKLGRAGPRQARRFDWRKTARDTIAEYRNLLR